MTLQVIAQHIDFAALARLVNGIIQRSDGRKGGRPTYPTEVMVRVMVLKRLYNLSDEQMQYQLRDRMSYQRFCLLQDAMNDPRSQHHLALWRTSGRRWSNGSAARCGWIQPIQYLAWDAPPEIAREASWHRLRRSSPRVLSPDSENWVGKPTALTAITGCKWLSKMGAEIVTTPLT